MLKFLFGIVKLTLFAALVLVAGQLIRIEGRTLSDRVKTGMSAAERAPIVREARRQAVDLADGARRAAQDLAEDARAPGATGKAKAAPNRESTEGAEIPDSERQKLRDLIRELNGSR